MLLLTGASGTVGRALLRRLPPPVIALGHREHLAGAHRTVAGDIASPDLRLPNSKEITAILHCAARTEFAAPLGDLRYINVGGTRNLLRLARNCPRLEKIAILSTVYVAGRRTGLVLEDDLEHKAGFVNAYERSKYEMERLVRGWLPHLPITIFRLSTIADDFSRPNAIHQALRLYYRGLVPMIPGTEESRLDLITLDTAADSIVYLFRNSFTAGRTYHIAAPDRDRITLDHFLRITAEQFGRHGARWASGALTPPPVVPLRTFRLLQRSAEQFGNAILRQVLRATGAFLPQFCYPKEFDQTNFTRDLRGSGICSRPLLEVYPAIVRDCLKSAEIRRHRGPA